MFQYSCNSAGGDAERYIMRESPVRGYTHVQWEMVVNHHAVVTSAATVSR